MTAYTELLASLPASPRRWLVTGGAGFIGGHIAEELLSHGQEVVVLDNFSTGKRANLAFAEANGWSGRLRVVEGDIRDFQACREAMQGVSVVHHHAAQISVPKSLQDPMGNHADNLDGFVNILEAAREVGVSRVVYASSSAVYGDAKVLPNHEDRPGACLSPYALSKYLNELYGDFYTRIYGVPCVGLRYFNVFGPRQDPKGAYAAVIAKWLDCLAANQPCTVFGDGSATRDFVFVKDIVQANLLAATRPEAAGMVFNVASGAVTDLQTLYTTLLDVCAELKGTDPSLVLAHAEPRMGDILHSSADIQRIQETLGYRAAYSLRDGLARLVASV